MDQTQLERIRMTFPKEERLHHRSLVEGLFRHGKSFYEFPFRVTYRFLSQSELEKNFRKVMPEGIGKVQMMVTVPKKKRRHAVDRVLMRRRIKEAYRLNKHKINSRLFEETSSDYFSFALVYIHDKNLPYVAVEDKMKILINKLQRLISKEE